MRRALFTLLIAASGLLAATPPAGANAATTLCPTGTTCYLALGDSLAFGYQPNLDATHGYAADIYGLLRAKYANLTAVNFGCVGETTSTMLGLNGSTCPYWKFTTGMTTTPQISQTLTFLQSHPGQVRLITIDIGINDMLNAIASHETLNQLVATLHQVSANLDQILTDLQNAAPGVPIMTMTYYDPFVVVSKSPLLPLAMDIFNSQITTVAQNHGVTVADVYTAFNAGSNPTATICALTWFCSTTHRGDPHPNTLGYAVIARTFWLAGADKI